MDNYLKAVLFGIIIAAPIGATEILIIRRTLVKGKISGIFTSLGASTADLCLAIVTIFGLTWIIEIWEQNDKILGIISGSLVISTGILIIKSKPTQDRNIYKSRSLIDFFSAFTMILTNPLSIMIFTILLPNYNLIDSNSAKTEKTLVILSIMIGEMAWRMTLIIVVNLFSKVFSEGNIYRINKGIGVILITIGIASTLSKFL